MITGGIIVRVLTQVALSARFLQFDDDLLAHDMDQVVLFLAQLIKTFLGHIKLMFIFLSHCITPIRSVLYHVLSGFATTIGRI